MAPSFYSRDPANLHVPTGVGIARSLFTLDMPLNDELLEARLEFIDRADIITASDKVILDYLRSILRYECAKFCIGTLKRSQ